LKQLIVGLDDLLIGVGEVILASVRARHDHIGTHWRRSNCQVLYDHVLWAGDVRTKTQQYAVLVRDFGQNPQCLFW
jgi:hypothetical protein